MAGAAARGLGPGPVPARRRQVSKTRAPGSPSTFLNFLFGPSLRKGLGGESPVRPFPPGGVWARAEAGPQSARDPAQSNFPWPETFRLWLQVYNPLRSQRGLTPSRVLGSLRGCPSLRTPPPPSPQGRAGAPGDLSGVGAGAPALAWGAVVTSAVSGWGRGSTLRDDRGTALASSQDAPVAVPGRAQR